MNNKESILNKINKLIDKYNNISENDKVKIVSDEVIDTENLYICLYDENRIGLFKKENYNYVDIYIGVDTDNVAVYVSKILTSYEKWYNNGEKIQIDGREYSATCRINSAFNLEGFKLMMYHEGLINDSNIRLIFSSEISEMLKYAYEYFNIRKNNKDIEYLTKSINLNRYYIEETSWLYRHYYD